MAAFKVRWPFYKDDEPPPWDKPGLSHRTRLELLQFGADEQKLTIEANKHTNWIIESYVRFILTALATAATWYWVSFVKSEVTDAIKASKDQAGSEHVLIALMTTTTANILGVWAIVARYVWHVDDARGKKSKGKKKKIAPDSDEDDK